MRLRTVLFALLAVPLLTACVNDGATYEIDGTREHGLSLIREQPYFWDSKVNLYMAVSRMPSLGFVGLERQAWTRASSSVILSERPRGMVSVRRLFTPAAR